MPSHYRFSLYRRASGSGHSELPYKKLFPAPEYDAEGRVVRLSPIAEKASAREVLGLLQPYVTTRFREQCTAVLPLAIYLALFQLLILRERFDNPWLISCGLLAVIVGLMLFMEGLKLGLMPFGTVIGAKLPRRSPLPLVLLVTFLLGIGVTFAEPAIGALKVAGQNVQVEKAPYLYALLNEWTDLLVLVVGASVGLAAVVGTLRFLYGWSLKPLIYSALLPLLGLSLYCEFQPELTSALGLAWDTGAVTTGPVTVPLVLALGVGIASAAGKGGSGLGGFGIVTLASLYPVIGVLLLLIYISVTQSPEMIIQAALNPEAGLASPAWYEASPGLEVIMGIRAILPLVLFLFAVLALLLRERLANSAEIILGIVFAILGMCIFNLGLTYGLSALGGSAGGLMPMAFLQIDGHENSPIYSYTVGLVLALVFAWVLGFGATVAEPALNALGITTQNLTNGVFRKRTLILSVSIGVAFGITLGVLKLIFDWPLFWMILPGYVLAIVLTYFSSETFVNVAWDSAGVTTGPITVPLVLSLGLGLGDATSAVEGFGILSMASVCPIISVMLSGFWARYKMNTQVKATTRNVKS